QGSTEDGRRQDFAVVECAERHEHECIRGDDRDQRERDRMLGRLALRSRRGARPLEAGCELGGGCSHGPPVAHAASWPAACLIPGIGGSAGVLYPTVERVAMPGARILVVDDEDDIRGLVRALLERAGHQVVDAPDGRAGLRELYASSPDLVMLDVAMPGLDGWE